MSHRITREGTDRQVSLSDALSFRIYIYMYLFTQNSLSAPRSDGASSEKSSRSILRSVERQRQDSFDETMKSTFITHNYINVHERASNKY